MTKVINHFHETHVFDPALYAALSINGLLKEKPSQNLAQGLVCFSYDTSAELCRLIDQYNKAYSEAEDWLKVGEEETCESATQT